MMHYSGFVVLCIMAKHKIRGKRVCRGLQDALHGTYTHDISSIFAVCDTHCRLFVIYLMGVRENVLQQQNNIA